jgi:leader peptidase (prepilin peptidase) / N-methyltransferase
MSENIIISSLVFVVGAIVGSFLNVCIVRLPKCESVVKPRSHCVHCQKMIPWYDNIPLVSYLVLGGKCRFCGKKISIRYWIVELLTAGVFVWFYQAFGLTPSYFAYMVMISGFIVAIFVDFEHRIIPDEISVGGMCCGLVLSLFIPEMQGVAVAKMPVWLAHLQSLGWSFVGALVGGASIYLMGLLGDVIFKKESMGGGDVKFLAMVGAFLGWQAALLTFFIAPFFGAVYGIVEKIRTKDSAIAYGPFLAVGALVSMFYGDAIITWIMHGYGIYKW